MSKPKVPAQAKSAPQKPIVVVNSECPPANPALGMKTPEVVEWNRRNLSREAFNLKYAGWASFDEYPHVEPFPEPEAYDDAGGETPAVEPEPEA